MEQLSNIKRFRELILENRISEAIKQLAYQINIFMSNNTLHEDYVYVKDIFNLLISNSGKFNGLEHDRILGIVDREKIQTTSAEVRAAMLYILDKLPTSFWQYKSNSNSTNYRIPLLENIETFSRKKSNYQYDFFICFSTLDRDQAKPIWETLRGYGFRVFISDDNLKHNVGFNFIDKIDHALAFSQNIIIIASQNAFNSIYVKDEYQSFYHDCHAKSPNERLMIVYKLSNFSIENLPRILKTKQIASSTEQILYTFINIYTEDIKDSIDTNLIENINIKKKSPIVSKSGKPSNERAKFGFNGQVYGKNRLVLAVIKNFVETNPQITFSQLDKEFPRELQQVKTHGTFKLESDARHKKYSDRYFLNPDDLIKLEDSTIAISTQWGYNFDGFLAFCRKKNIQIVELPKKNK